MPKIKQPNQKRIPIKGCGRGRLGEQDGKLFN